MRHTARIEALVGLVLALLVLGGCGSYYGHRYKAAVIQNRRALQQLELGMSAAAVGEIMGRGEVIQYKKIQFVDPWRSESFRLDDGTDVLLLFYLTKAVYSRWTSPKYHDQDLTPIVFENDKVVGWGWSYIRRNPDRYQGMPAEEQG